MTTSPTQKIAEAMLTMRRYLTKRKRAAVDDPSSPCAAIILISNRVNLLSVQLLETEYSVFIVIFAINFSRFLVFGVT